MPRKGWTVINVRDKLYERVAKVADENDLSISELTALILNEYIDSTKVIEIIKAIKATQAHNEG